MGKVKTEQIKRVANQLMDRYPDKFSNVFDDNKHAVSELTTGASTRVRNQIAGYITSSYAEEESESPIENPEAGETET